MAIDAFMTDLEFLNIANRVVGMTFSEFGRRIMANKSYGTDHGAAAPVILFGNQVIPGVLGVNPAIPAVVNTNSNVTMQHDFRAVYASLLNQWFRIDKNLVDAVLLRSFNTLPLIKQDETAVPEIESGNTASFRNAPNPFKNETRIYFDSADEDILIEIFDVKGVLRKTLAENSYSSGSHVIDFRADDLPAEIYYARLQKSGGSRTIAIMKS